MAGVRQNGTDYHSSLEHLDPVNAILSDRYFEAETWPHDRDMPTGVFEIVMPLLLSCVVALSPPDPDTTLPNPLDIPYLDFSDAGYEGLRLKKKSFTGSFSTLMADNADALIQYCSATSVENTLRQMSGMDALTRISDETQTILFAHLSAICNASEQCHSADGNKAQYRLGWDEIASVVEDALAKDGSRISKHFERVIPLARNARFDADTAREQLPWGRRNESLEKASDRVRALPKIEVLPKDMLSNDMTYDIRTDLKKVLLGRDRRWKTNVFGRDASLSLAKSKRKLLDDILQSPKGTQSGVHVLSVDFAFARCDSSVVISIPGVFPEGSFIDDVKIFDILRGAHEEVDQPTVTTSEVEDNGSDGMPSFLGGAQSLCVRLLEDNTNVAKGTAVFPPPQPEPPAAETVASMRTQAHPKGTTEWFHDIILPLLFLEYKRGFLSPLQGMDQTRFYLISGVSYLAAIGIINFPIFGVSTVGSRGRLLCAWGTRKEGSERISTHIADTNCPEWDISDRAQAIRFALFLINLRTTLRDALVARFEAVRQDFLEAWEDRESDGSALKWTVEAQRKEAAYRCLEKLCDQRDQSDEPQVSRSM